jgi:protein-S-isoprenylcysteine O-methyltransferase Ste14
MNLELKIIPPFQLIISAGLMVSLAVLLPDFYFAFQISLNLAIALVIVASLISALALYDFHKHQTTFHPHTPEKTRKVVDTGIFAYTRNPMYISLVTLLLALGVFLQNYSSFIVVPVFIYYITRFQIVPEEKMLDKLFPNDYQAYCQKVRRWV